MINSIQFSKKVLMAGFVALLITGCGIEHKNDKDKNEPQANASSGDVIPGDNPNLTHENDPNKLSVNLALSVNDAEVSEHALKVVQTKENAILLMPEIDTPIRIAVTEDDTTKFFSTISFASMHERMRNKEIVVSYLDTSYQEEGSTEDKLYGVDLHDPVKIPWENKSGVISFEHRLQTKGIGGFNREFEQGRTIQQQFFTFLLRDSVKQGADTLLICIPIVVDQTSGETYISYSPSLSSSLSSSSQINDVSAIILKRVEHYEVK